MRQAYTERRLRALNPYALLAVGYAVLVWCAACAGLTRKSTTPPKTLAVNPPSIAFGDVVVGKASTQLVTLTNTSSQAIDVVAVQVSHPEFKASFNVPTTVAAGQSASVSVSFLPTSVGSASGNVTVASSATNSPVAVALSGNGVEAPTVSGLVAFPGAEGGGAHSVGGRGGKAYEVTNLNDSGSGSLRACVETSGPRTCVFRIGGHLTLHSQLHVASPFLTIAGQTAPGGGIELSSKDPSGSAFFTGDLIRIETHDVIIRYVKLRLGYIAGANYANTIVIQSGSQYNIVIDHCSVYWGMWDNISVYATGSGSNKNITFSWNIIAEPLLQPGATGTVAVNVSGATPTIADNSTDIDFHHNLFTSADHRTPLHTVRSGRLVNNIIFNWNYYALRTKGSKDIIGNYFKPGSMNHSPGHEIQAWTTAEANSTSFAPSLYLSGNAGPHNSYNPATNNWSTMTALASNESAGEASALSTAFERSSPLPTAAVAITVDPAPSLALNGGTFLSSVGASRQLSCDGTWGAARDTVDNRVVNEFLNGTGTSNRALQHETEVGGFPSLANGVACKDSDHDGIPDAWELAHGLNPNDPSDAPKVAPNGYTFLENYLNGTDPN
jgi:pectate lyase